ncbi:MAG: LysM peptidoglycan-binding domain-containing protein [Opitutales bacterium]|jgi:LysM repeat protein|nr:LysM peptidoglycan-binding domain-containing protein [Opitutales bacterium]MDP4644554.1 LysM peptidoglycan-binding domain-containing protein [Opitutales bacterium]MDP4777353.1 LysM peptidoglycan-binding domain-containing protein [Opitutales bacterium]MDP4879529.1 LysM peptidoglycan-binding domain-containing protein [Opitutales bacterium]MDP4883902.1 LysM peptidoglycan-binding domain-containing protein [Opitutales bacterium]
MIKPLLTLLFLLSGTLILTQPVSAQSDVRVAVANLNQDVTLIAQQLKTLRLEIEEIQRENVKLRAQVAAATSNRSTENQISNLSSAIEALRREYRQADEAQKQQIIAEVTRQIDALAKETQGALNTVANAVGSQPNVVTPVHFSEDYPKTGKPYVVRSGDTLSGIARAHGSTVKHIQNANKIANPAKDLQVGQTIFIPIAQ